MQDYLGVMAHLTNLEKLECTFKAPLQPDFAEAVLGFCTECARRPSRNPHPLVVEYTVYSVTVSGLGEQEVHKLRGIKKAWRARDASLVGGKRRDVELHVYYGDEYRESIDS